MARAVIVVPRLVVSVVNDPPILIRVRGKEVQSSLEIVVYDSRLILEGSEPGDPAGGKAGNSAIGNTVSAYRLVNAESVALTR